MVCSFCVCPQKEHFAVTVEDITERKKEEELAFNERKYRELAESLPETIFKIDGNGNIVFVNQKASQITGYSQEEFGSNFSFVRFVVPVEREEVMANIGQLMLGESLG
jgi:PAS domain S-box-containing protein